MDSTAKQKHRHQALWYIGIGAAFIVLGGAGLAVPFVGITTAQDWDRLEEEAVVLAAAASASGTLTPAPSANVEHREIKNRLVIPKIGVDMALLGGDDADALLKGGWLFPGTAQPGGVGNSVVFGHRFRYLPPVSNTFFKLDKLVAGDEFTVRWGSESFTYRVVSMTIVSPDDFSVLESPAGKRWMTLITCAPAFSTKYRLAVFGELVE